MPGKPVDRVPVRRLVGMIYWYGWGSMEFDIRIVRSILGLPRENPADQWFAEETPDPIGSFEAIIQPIVDALQEQDRRFLDVLKEHDSLVFAEPATNPDGPF